MAFCSFDDGAALFDSTPVENMFITEYMLRAPGDFVKVYLYGLMLCYHHAERMSLSSMARDLDLQEEDVERAMRYWARDGLERRTGDNPVRYTYYNLKQITLARAESPGEKLYNRRLVGEIERILDKQEVHPSDYNIIFDWIDVLELPEEVVLMLLQMEKEKSKTGRVKLSYADSVAREWAQSGVKTVEDVEKIVVMKQERERQLRLVLAELGQRRPPSEAEKKAFNKWIDEWGFTYEQIRESCEKTLSGTPSMNYLDAILSRRFQEKPKVRAEEEDKKYRFGRDLLIALGRTGVSPTQRDIELIDNWRRSGYSQQMIMKAAETVHLQKVVGNFRDVDQQLAQWRSSGLANVAEVQTAEMKDRMLDELLIQVYNVFGSSRRPTKADRQLIGKWIGEMGFSMDMVLLAAQYALPTGASTRTIDKILTQWNQAGIATVQEAQLEHGRHAAGGGQKAGGTAGAQDQMARYTPEERRVTYGAALVDLDREDGE